MILLIFFVFTPLICYIVSSNINNFDLEKLYKTKNFDNHHFSNAFSNTSIEVLNKFNYNYVVIPVAEAVSIKLEEDIFVDCIRIDKPKILNIALKDYKMIVQAEKHNWNYYYCLYKNTYDSLNIILENFCLYSAIIEVQIEEREIEMIYFEKDIDAVVNDNDDYETIQIEEGNKIKCFQISKTDLEGIRIIKDKFLN